MASNPKPVPPTPSTVATPSGSEADRLYGSYRDGGIRSPHTTRRLKKYAAKYPSPQQGTPANQLQNQHQNQHQNQPPPGPPPQQPQQYGYQYQPSQGPPASQYQQYPYQQQQLQGAPPPQQYWSPQYPYGHQLPPPPPPAHYNQPPQHQPHQPQRQHQPQQPHQYRPRGAAQPQTPTAVAVPRPTTAQMDLLLDQYGDEIQQFASPTPSRQPGQGQGQVHDQTDETAIDTDTPKARMESLLQQFKEGMEAAMHADFEMRKIVYKEEFQ